MQPSLGQDMEQLIEGSEAAAANLERLPPGKSIEPRARRRRRKQITDADIDRQALNRYKRDELKQWRSLEKAKAPEPRWDVRFIMVWAHRIITTYDMVTSFALFHVSARWDLVVYAIACTGIGMVAGPLAGPIFFACGLVGALAAIALSRTSVPTKARRKSWCEQCTFRYRRESTNQKDTPVLRGLPIIKGDRCRAESGGLPCNCPDDITWRPADLDYVLGWQGAECPIGNWDRGDYAPEWRDDDPLG